MVEPSSPMMYTGVTRYAQVTGVAVCSLSLTWLSTILRFYVRIGILKFFGREDWLTVAAMIVFTVFCALCLRANVYGLGAHIYNIPDSTLVIGFKLTFICELLYVASTTVTKISIGAYFLRLSSKSYQKSIIYSTLSTVLVISTMYFFFLLFQCMPISYLWTRYEGETGKCLGKDVLANVTYAHSAMSAATDWAFGILPIFFVWKMQMNPRTKISVVLILSLGFFASTATIVRIVYIRRLAETQDLSWEGINLVKWSMVEPAIAITAMNIATLRPLFKNFFLFASKRFDARIDDEDQDLSMQPDDTKLSTSGHACGKNAGSWNSVQANDYSVEFAEMLGLSRLGITTEITGGGSEREKAKARRCFWKRSWWRCNGGEKGADGVFEGKRMGSDSLSRLELDDGLSGSEEDRAAGIGWGGIQYTMTIKQEIKD